jgi:replicative DNA helicase
VKEDIILPSDINSERTILGSIFLNNEAFYEGSVEIVPDDFYLDSNRKIYTVINDILFRLVEGVEHADIITVANELAKRRWLDSIGGRAYLFSLTEGLPSHLNVDEYCSIVKEKSRLRKLIRACDYTETRALGQGETATSLINGLESGLAEIIGEGTSGAVRIGEVTAAVEERVRKNRNISPDKTALEMTWGLEGLDSATRGCFRGEFTVIGGESGGSKTSYGVQLSIANAMEGTPVIWFSMEMSKEALAQRFYSSMSDILTSRHLRDPRLMNIHAHVPEMERISKKLSSLPIDIDDTSPLRIDTLKGRTKMLCRKWKKETGASRMLVIIDYVQLIKGMPNMVALEQFNNIIFTLRDIPKEIPEVHIVALSQYSQGEKFVKKSSGRTKDSLYGGSVIHHAAQNIFMITVEDPEKRGENDLLNASFKIAKQREGKRTKVNFQFDRDHLRFVGPK